MKKFIFLTLFTSSLAFPLIAQHDYDGQGIIYSLPTLPVSVGIGGFPNQSYTLDVNGTINATNLYINGTALPTPSWSKMGSDISFMTGNVGIGGLPNSSYILDVHGTMNASDLFITGTINTTNLNVNGVAITGPQWSETQSGIVYMSGNVGLGISPNNFHPSNNQLVIGDGIGSNGLTLFSQNNSKSRIAFTDINSTVQEGMIEYNHSTDYLNFKVNNTSKMFVDSDGDMGLLSTSSQFKLGLGLAGPHGFLFGDDGNEGLQLLYRTIENQLVVENKNDGTSGDILFSIDYDNEFSYFKGFVGIGKTNPTQALDVNGWVRFDGVNSNDEIQFESQTNFHRISFHEVRFYDWDTNSDMLTINDGKVGIGTNNPLDALDIHGGNIVLNSNKIFLKGSNDDFHSIQWRFFFDPTVPTLERVLIDGPIVQGWHGGALSTGEGGEKPVLTWLSSGNVGINVPNPSFALDVKGIVRFDGDNSEDELISKPYPGYRSLEFYQLRFHEWGMGDVLTLSEGKVGIWNTSPTVALDVVGTIKSTTAPATNAFVVTNNSSNGIDFVVKGDGRVFAREVEVTLIAFPDYVFGEQYELMSLTHLRTYIETQKHLPGIKSASEIEEEGIGLGELAKIQMEKIEELTLYILQLEERINMLESSGK